MRRLVALVAACAMAASCSSGDEAERGSNGLGTPQFAPDTATDEASSSATAGGAEGASPSTSPTSVPAGGQTAETTTTTVAGSPPTAAPETVSFDDPIGDAVGGLDDDPPAWADLAGATLLRQGGAYRLTVRLGDTAPTTAPGPETMNVATFFDIDGDGAIDHELWVNLGEAGWGPTWWTGDRARPGEASNVTVEVSGNEVRMSFPDVMLDAPARFRFSVASEYGELSVIGSEFAHRDDAPDDDQSVSFPD